MKTILLSNVCFPHKLEMLVKSFPDVDLQFASELYRIWNFTSYRLPLQICSQSWSPIYFHLCDKCRTVSNFNSYPGINESSDEHGKTIKGSVIYFIRNDKVEKQF